MPVAVLDGSKAYRLGGTKGDQVLVSGNRPLLGNVQQGRFRREQMGIIYPRIVIITINIACTTYSHKYYLYYLSDAH